MMPAQKIPAISARWRTLPLWLRRPLYSLMSHEFSRDFPPLLSSLLGLILLNFPVLLAPLLSPSPSSYFCL